MRGLLYKEFYQFKFDMYVIVGLQLFLSGICIVFGITMKSEAAPEALCMMLSLCYIVALLLGSILSSEFFSKDEKRPWCNFAFSLPQTEKGQVAVKYYAVLILHLMILCFCFVTDVIVVAIYGNAVASGITVAVVFFSMRMLVHAIGIPFMLRFGATTGINVEASCFGITLMLIGIYALFGDVSFLFQDNIKDALLSFVTSGNVMWILALLPYVAGVAYYLSYRVSLKVYRKGAESYGQ